SYLWSSRIESWRFVGDCSPASPSSPEAPPAAEVPRVIRGTLPRIFTGLVAETTQPQGTMYTKEESRHEQATCDNCLEHLDGAVGLVRPGIGERLGRKQARSGGCLQGTGRFVELRRSTGHCDDGERPKLGDRGGTGDSVETH